MANYKTPGVYVEEISTLPPSVGQVSTAVPAFIGYTEEAKKSGKSILQTPTRITSMLDYTSMFGGAPKIEKINVKMNADNTVKDVEVEKPFYLYDSVRMYFANGGGECYIVSVGKFTKEENGTTTKVNVEMQPLLDGIAALAKEDHPTMLVCPDAMLLKKKDQAYTVQQTMLMQCNKLQDRVAILDIYDGDKPLDEKVVQDFRDGIGINHLKYGAAYYPWIQTTLQNDFSFENIKLKASDDSDTTLESMVDDVTAIKNLDQAIKDVAILKTYAANPLKSDPKKELTEVYSTLENETHRNTVDEIKHYVTVIKSLIQSVFTQKDDVNLKNDQIKNELKQKVTYSSALATQARKLTTIDVGMKLGLIAKETDFTPFVLKDVDDAVATAAYPENATEDNVKKARTALKSIFEEVVNVIVSIRKDSVSIMKNLDQVVFDTSVVYKSIVNEVQNKVALLPPSGAMAGIYAQVDANRGVWKAPANVSLSSVSAPWIKLDNDQQEDLNVDTNAGKSINAIRAFTGKGTLVWGARTLAGNDNEWRYISVRRFFNMVEKSVKLSTNWAVFESNDATTWIRVKAMIENYLTNLWQAGALAGGSPDQAFFVNIGIGSTMSAVDILEGRMNVEIGMAVVRPAEFIILKFSHKLQES